MHVVTLRLHQVLQETVSLLDMRVHDIGYAIPEHLIFTVLLRQPVDSEDLHNAQ